MRSFMFLKEGSSWSLESKHGKPRQGGTVITLQQIMLGLDLTAWTDENIKKMPHFKESYHHWLQSVSLCLFLSLLSFSPSIQTVPPSPPRPAVSLSFSLPECPSVFTELRSPPGELLAIETCRTEQRLTYQVCQGSLNFEWSHVYEWVKLMYFAFKRSTDQFKTFILSLLES